MSTPDHDVLEAMDRAAMDPPSMSLSAGSVLSGGKSRVRRRRTAGAGMSLAAAVIAVTAWVGLGPTSDTLTQEIAPAGATPWDEAIDFEAPLDGGKQSAFSGFVGARVERGPGEEHFTVSVASGDTRVEVQRVDVDLPGAMELFRSGGNAVVVTHEEFPGEPALQLRLTDEANEWTGSSATDGDTRVHVWWIDGAVTPEALLDVYWVSDEEMVAASGTEVINAAISVEGYDTRVAIVPERNVWVELTTPFTGVQPLDGQLVEAPSAEGVVAVLPEGARDAEAHVSADVWGENGSYDTENIQLPLTLREVGDYVVGAAPLSESDFDQEIIQMQAAHVTWTDEAGDLQPDLDPAPLSAEGEWLPDGTVRVRFSATDDEVVFDPQNDTVVAAPSRDGGWVVIATRPDAMTVIDNSPDGSGYSDWPRLFMRTSEGRVPSEPSDQQSGAGTGTVAGAEQLIWFTVAPEALSSATGADDVELDVLFDSNVDGPWGPAATNRPWFR